MDRLLDQSVQDRRDPQHACSSTRLRNVHPPHRPGFTSSSQKSLFDACPVLLQAATELTDLHAVDTAGTAIGLHGPEGLEHVLSPEHSFEQPRLSRSDHCRETRRT